MNDGHHGYFSPLLAIAIASLLLCSLIAVLRLAIVPGNRAVRGTPSSLALYVTLAALQVAGFAALEFVEGNPPDAIGCGIEALTALVIAAFVFFFISFAQRYVCTDPDDVFASRSERVGCDETTARRLCAAAPAPCRLSPGADSQRPPPYYRLRPNRTRPAGVRALHVCNRFWR